MKKEKKINLVMLRVLSIKTHSFKGNSYYSHAEVRSRRENNAEQIKSSEGAPSINEVVQPLDECYAGNF